MPADEEHDVGGRGTDVVGQPPLSIIIRAITTRASRVIVPDERHAINGAVVHRGYARHIVIRGDSAQIGPTTRPGWRHARAVGRDGEGVCGADPYPTRAESCQVRIEV
jgi:hypothetical protein